MTKKTEKAKTEQRFIPGTDIPAPEPVKQITALTEQQKALMPVWRDKWIKIGLSTEPADRATFEKNVAVCYKAAKLAPPKRVVWVDSPLVLTKAAPRAAVILSKKFATGKEEVAKMPSPEVRAVIDQALGRPSTDAELGQIARSDIANLWSRYIGGQFWVGGWYLGSPASVSYLHEVCGLDLGDMQERADAYAATARSACWWWPHTDFVVVCERPKSITLDDRGRLHDADKPAMQFRDGYSVYAWHGVTVPADVILKPQDITVERIKGERNVEVRRVMLERYGFERFVADCGAKMIHKDEFGELYRQDLEGDEPLTMVRVRNSTPEPDGTFKHYFLAVHPELRPLLGGDTYGEPQELTARNAVASTFGLRGEEYKPGQET